jgi:hypothetical protein
MNKNNSIYSNKAATVLAIARVVFAVSYIFEQLARLLSICKHLQAFASICKHLQAFASICKHLQAFASIHNEVY